MALSSMRASALDRWVAGSLGKANGKEIVRWICDAGVMPVCDAGWTLLRLRTAVQSIRLWKMTYI